MGDAEEKLEEALTKNQQSQASLREAAQREQALDEELKDIMANLTATRSDLSMLQSDHNSTRAELRRTKVSLSEALSAHYETLAALRRRNPGMRRQWRSLS